MPHTDESPRRLDPERSVHTLRHIETSEYICLRHDQCEYLAAFSDGDTALQFREELGLLEHVDVVSLSLGNAPFDHFWLDGEMVASDGAPVGANRGLRTA